MAFGQKLANAFAPLSLGIILGIYGWKETTQGKVVQTEEALAALQASITLVPSAVLLLAILTLVLIYRPSLAQPLFDNK